MSEVIAFDPRTPAKRAEGELAMKMAETLEAIRPEINEGTESEVMLEALAAWHSLAMEAAKALQFLLSSPGTEYAVVTKLNKDGRGSEVGQTLAFYRQIAESILKRPDGQQGAVHE